MNREMGFSSKRQQVKTGEGRVALISGEPGIVSWQPVVWQRHTALHGHRVRSALD
jgi:hypothetical protein